VSDDIFAVTLARIRQQLEELQNIVRAGGAVEPLGFHDRKLSKIQLARREAITTRSVDRRVKDGRLPPPDGAEGRQPYWWLSALQRHDREHTGLVARHEPPELAAARARSRKGAPTSVTTTEETISEKTPRRRQRRGEGTTSILAR
jgi:hypothetical protein